MFQFLSKSASLLSRKIPLKINLRIKRSNVLLNGIKMDLEKLVENVELLLDHFDVLTVVNIQIFEVVNNTWTIFIQCIDLILQSKST
jgi:hypothetical protein